jgi:uncharacterized protein (TIGR00369 family)
VEAVNNDELRARLEATDSPIDQTLGLVFKSVAHASGICTLEFTIGRGFTNPMGVVFGGIQTSMLDAALSLAGTIKSGLIQGMVSLEIKTRYLKAAPPGVFRAEGRTISLGKRVAFLASEFFGPDGELVARASGTAFPMPFPES